MIARSQAERVKNPFSEPTATRPTSSHVPKSDPAATEGQSTDPRTNGRLAATAKPVPQPKLELRALTGYEEAFVETHLQSANTAQLVNNVLACCLGLPEADRTEALERVRGLLTADRDAALVRLRLLSLGSEVRTEVTCPSCDEMNEVNFDLDQLPIDFERPPAVFEANLPDGRVAHLRLPTAGDQEDMFALGLETAAERRSWLIARLLVRIDDVKGPFEDRYAHGLPVAIRGAIEDAVNRSSPDLDLSMGVTCRTCEAQFSAPFDVSSFFLRK